MKIVVSRLSNGSEVTAFADFDIIGVQMDVSDFLRLMAYKINEPGLEEKLITNLTEVLNMMKKETVKVVV